MDTEDKLAWCDLGAQAEKAFAIERLYDLGLSGAVNVSKKQDPFTHDLFINFPADLKSVRTPLFKAEEMFGIDPQFAVTFNGKDGQRYSQMYPNIVVVFDIFWEVCEKTIDDRVYKVEPMRLTVAGFLSDIRRAIKKSGSHKIVYKNRVNDQSGNAKESWVFDARDLHKLGG
jgi:hypothetical protein